jgi:hypothetical protein
MTFKSSFCVPLDGVVEDSKSGCIFPMYNESFFTDNPLELIWDDLNFPADILLRVRASGTSVNISLFGPKKRRSETLKIIAVLKVS